MSCWWCVFDHFPYIFDYKGIICLLECYVNISLFLCISVWNENMDFTPFLPFVCSSVCLSVCQSSSVYACVCIYLVPRVEIRSGISGMSLSACPRSPPSHSSVPNIQTRINGLMWPISTLPVLNIHMHTQSHTHPPLAVLYSPLPPSSSQAFGHQSRPSQSPFSKHPDLLNQQTARSIVPQLDLECVCWFGLDGRLG